MEKPSKSTRVRHAVQGCKLKNKRMILVHFQGKPFNITVIQVYAATTNAERAKVEWSYEDLQDLRELIPKKKNPKKQKMPFSSSRMQKQDVKRYLEKQGKFGLGVQNEAGKSLTEL